MKESNSLTAKARWYCKQRENRLAPKRANRIARKAYIAAGIFIAGMTNTPTARGCSMLAEIRAEIAPKLEAIRQAENYSSNGTELENYGPRFSYYEKIGGHNGEVQTSSGRGYFYPHAVGTVDKTDLANENEPMFSVVQAGMEKADSAGRKNEK